MGSQEEIEQIIGPIDKLKLFQELHDIYGHVARASSTSVRMSKLIISHFAALQYLTGNREPFSIELYKELFQHSNPENVAELGPGKTPLLPNLKKIVGTEFNEIYIGGTPPLTATKFYDGLFPYAVNYEMKFDLIMSVGVLSPGLNITQPVEPSVANGALTNYLSNHPYAHAITLGLSGPTIPLEWTNGVPGLFYINPQRLMFDELGVTPDCTDMFLVGPS